MHSQQSTLEEAYSNSEASIPFIQFTQVWAICLCTLYEHHGFCVLVYIHYTSSTMLPINVRKWNFLSNTFLWYWIKFILLPSKRKIKKVTQNYTMENITLISEFRKADVRLLLTTELVYLHFQFAKRAEFLAIALTEWIFVFALLCRPDLFCPTCRHTAKCPILSQCVPLSYPQSTSIFLSIIFQPELKKKYRHWSS